MASADIASTLRPVLLRVTEFPHTCRLPSRARMPCTVTAEVYIRRRAIPMAAQMWRKRRTFRAGVIPAFPRRGGCGVKKMAPFLEAADGAVAKRMSAKRTVLSDATRRLYGALRGH